MRHDTRGVWISQALSRPRAFTSDVLGLRRNMVVLSLAIFCVGLGEELWARFLPKYLEALGASVLATGAFGAFQDLLEALYPYPGGVLADRWGEFVITPALMMGMDNIICKRSRGLHEKYLPANDHVAYHRIP
jgi:hypothetical protein